MREIRLPIKILFVRISDLPVGLTFGKHSQLTKPVGTIFLELITAIAAVLLLVLSMPETPSLDDIRNLERRNPY